MNQPCHRTGVHRELRYLAARSRISHGLYSTYKGLYRQAKQAFTGRVRLKL